MTALRWAAGAVALGGLSGGDDCGGLAARGLLKFPHPDVAVETGSVLDLQPPHLHVSLHATRLAQGQLVTSGDLAFDLTPHGHAGPFEQRFDRRSCRDVDVACDPELTLGPALDLQAALVRELALQAIPRP